MKKDEYSFLELFGNIDDEYIVQALQPWKRQTRRYMVYHIGRKAVCLAIIVMLGLCLAFHDQVYAAVSRFTTMIAESRVEYGQQWRIYRKSDNATMVQWVLRGLFLYNGKTSQCKQTSMSCYNNASNAFTVISKSLKLSFWKTRFWCWYI